MITRGAARGEVVFISNIVDPIFWVRSEDFHGKLHRSSFKKLPDNTIFYSGGRWARGSTYPVARDNFIKLKTGVNWLEGHGVLVFDDDTEVLGMDEAGRVHYKGNPPLKWEYDPDSEQLIQMENQS